MDNTENLADLAKRHLIMNFTPASKYRQDDLPIYVRGEHCSIFTDGNKQFFDGLAGLFCSQLGYSHGAEIGKAMQEQAENLHFYTTWGAAQPPAVRLAAKIAELAPGDLNRVFFTTGGGEANEAAIKMARQYHQARGESARVKFIARRVSYHGTSFGALSLNGMTDIRKMFEPLMNGARHVRNTKRYGRPSGETEEQFTSFLLEDLETLIVQEGPDTVAAVVMEPLQNAGGSLTPPEGYFDGVRALCDKYGILLLADEVITGFGRLGTWFGSELYGIKPDMLVFAKGVASGHVPLGGVIVRDELLETVLDGPAGMFNHGVTYSGHPVSCAAALANIEIMEREGIVENVATLSSHFQDKMREVKDKHDFIGDVRGEGFHRSFELVTNHESKRWDDPNLASIDFVNLHLNPALTEVGLLCRVAIDAGGQPLVQLSPPLVMNRNDIDELTGLIDSAFEKAADSAGLISGSSRKTVMSAGL